MGRWVSRNACSIKRKRLSNLALALRSAVSGSTFKWRARLTTTNSRSPTSSLMAWLSLPAMASSTSSSSSRTLSSTGKASGQSKPTWAVRFCSLAARDKAGRATGTSSSSDNCSGSAAFSARSSALSSSQRCLTWASSRRGVSAGAYSSPVGNTWGWRRINLRVMLSTTPANSKRPSSSASWL
ncbi:hypothetical protein D3C84_789780 [compost metagenome]